MQQAKDCQTRPWFTWLDELERQTVHGGALWSCIVSKRPGKSDAAEAMAVMRNCDWLRMAARIHELESMLASYRNGQPRAVQPAQAQEMNANG